MLLLTSMNKQIQVGGSLYEWQHRMLGRLLIILTKSIYASLVGFNKKRIDAVEVGIKGWMMDFRMSDG